LQTYDVKHFNMAKTRLKVIQASCCRLMNHLPLEALPCLEVNRLVMSSQSSLA
jgi:hypothetical protein